jgi:hypothetical protein
MRTVCVAGSIAFAFAVGAAVGGFRSHADDGDRSAAVRQAIEDGSARVAR